MILLYFSDLQNHNFHEDILTGNHELVILGTNIEIL